MQYHRRQSAFEVSRLTSGLSATLAVWAFSLGQFAAGIKPLGFAMLCGVLAVRFKAARPCVADLHER
jgi:hypothetical protein